VGRYPERDRVMVRLVYRHGLRASEACDLRWDHLNLDEGTITVRRRKMGKDSTHSMDRDELRDLRKLWRETNSPYVFTTERGGPLSVRVLQYVVAGGRKGRRPARGTLTPARAAAHSLIINDVDARLVAGVPRPQDARHDHALHGCLAEAPARLAGAVRNGPVTSAARQPVGTRRPALPLGAHSAPAPVIVPFSASVVTRSDFPGYRHSRSFSPP
jgi:type 1 fimbriae regulatory protein FimB